MFLSDLPIIAEAIALVVPVEIGLRYRSIDSLVARLERRRRHPGSVARAVDVERAATVVDRLGSFYPLRATCLKKSLVLLGILRRRGVPAELRLGVRKVEGQFSAHAWIESDGRTLLATGGEHCYATLPLADALERSRTTPRSAARAFRRGRLTPVTATGHRESLAELTTAGKPSADTRAG
jgi:Transglutaminase-like superfamily